MSLKQGIGDAEFLNRRVPRSNKYQHIRSRLDTGCSLSRYMEKVEDLQRNYRYRQDEIFKRLKVTTFAQLILQVASVPETSPSVSDASTPDDALSLASEAELESLAARSSGSNPSPCSERQEVQTARSTLLSVISGVGELSLCHIPDPECPADCDRRPAECPYLLLDVRGRDQYNLCHIITAQSFPITSLARTMNPYTRELLQYKNAPGKIIIVYDEDERIASDAATAMCQRGFENLFMLSGGLKVLVQKFPGSLLSGPLPPPCASPSLPPSGPPSGPPSAPPSVCASSWTATPGGPTRSEQRWSFTVDELDRLTNQLEEALVPSNTSSRASSRSSTVSLRSARSRRSSSSSRPWK